MRFPARYTLAKIGIGTAIVPLAAIMTGCVVLGPRQIETGRANYNVAIQRTESEQLLLNIVRLRYNDPVLFLDLSTVSSSMSTGASSSWSFPFIFDSRSSVSSSLSGHVSESPTVIYRPRTGDDFARPMLSPLDPRTLALILQSGWSIERMLRLFVQSINDVPNATTATGPTPSVPPQFQDFVQLARDLRRLQEAGVLRLAITVPESDATSGARAPQPGSVQLVFSPRAFEMAEYTRLRERLGFAHGLRSLQLRHAHFAENAESVGIVTRSLFSTLYFLAQSVDVPAEDIRRGFAVETRDSAGTPFDWQQVLGGLFRVESSKNEPKDAAVKVHYRDHWFFIRDSDNHSKSTFNVIAIVLSIQTGDGGRLTPLLTIPTSGG